MSFDDYHQISDFIDRFNELTGGNPKLKYTEIMSENDYGYKALFYVGNQDKKYKSVLKSYKDSIREENSNES